VNFQELLYFINAYYLKSKVVFKKIHIIYKLFYFATRIFLFSYNN